MEQNSIYLGVGAIALALALGWFVLHRVRKRSRAGEEVTSRPFEDNPSWLDEKPPSVPATPDLVVAPPVVQEADVRSEVEQAPPGMRLDVHSTGPAAADPVASLPTATIERPTDPIGRAHAYEDSQRGLDEVQQATEARQAAHDESHAPQTTAEILQAQGVPLPLSMQEKGASGVKHVSLGEGDWTPTPEQKAEIVETFQTVETGDALPALQDPVTPVPEGATPGVPNEPGETSADVVPPAVTPPSAYEYANREQVIAAVEAYRLPGRTKVASKAHQYRNALKVFVDEVWQKTEPSVKSPIVPWVKSFHTGTGTGRTGGGDYIYWVHLHFIDGGPSPVKIKLTSR